MDSGVDCSTPSLVPEHTGLYTSCEEAAAIIATMRGHSDEERARRELGCEALSSCRIQNTSLLDIMDA
jgi:tartrate dehydratase beta subunit/fumarate hydratase class I family protein